MINLRAEIAGQNIFAAVDAMPTHIILITTWAFLTKQDASLRKNVSNVQYI